MSKFLKYTIPAILIAQFCLSFSSLYSKYDLATNEDIELINIKTTIPASYYSKSNYITLRTSIPLEYNEDMPIFEKLNFRKSYNGKTATYHNKRKEIYLPISKENDELVIKSYATKEPAEGLYLKAQVSVVTKNNETGKMTINPDIQNLGNYNVEGDKIKEIKAHAKGADDFNKKLSTLVSNKSITEEERKERRKTAYISLAVGKKGNFAIRDYVIDGKSIEKDFL